MYARYLLSGVAALALAATASVGIAATGGSTTRQSHAMACCSVQAALHLSKVQKRRISRALTGPTQLPPSDFHASPDSILPESLTLSPIPRKLAGQFPMLNRDDYAMLKSEEVLLVNPQTRKVVAVIKDWSDAGLGG